MTTTPETLPAPANTAAALLALAEAVGVDCPPDRARAAALDAADAATPFQQLTRAGLDVALRVRPEQLSPRAARRFGTPLARVVGGTWLVVGGDVHFSARELAERCGVGPGDPVDWLSAAPLHPATPGGGGHDGHHGDDEHHGPSPFRRLVGLMWLERSDIWLAVVFALGYSILYLATPIAVDALVSTVAFGTVLQPLVVLALALFGCLVLAGVLRGLQTFVIEILQRRLFVRMAGDLAHRLPHTRLDAFDGGHGPEVVNRFFDVLTVQKAAGTLLVDGFGVALQLTLGLILLAFYHPFLLAYAGILVLSLGGIAFGLGRRAVRTSINESIAKYRVAGWLEEMARHPTAFKLAGGPEYALAAADRLTRDYLVARQAHFRIYFRQVVALLTLQAAATALLLGVGGFLVIAEPRALTLGQLVAAEIVVALAVGSFDKLGKYLETYYDLLTSVDKLGHLLDLPQERRGGSAPGGAGPAALEVRNLTFGHDPHRPLFADMSFRIAPGERIAVTSDRPAGKSTLLELLFALREPQTGTILLDGVDARDLRLDMLREQIALVSPETQAFEGSVLDNVRLGRDDVSAADVRAALATVGLLDEIHDLPAGLQTPLATGGAPLSASQTRRLMIARALTPPPRVLLLDSVLDKLSAAQRERVADQLLAPDAPWTLLLVTGQPELRARCTRELRLP